MSFGINCAFDFGRGGGQVSRRIRQRLTVEIAAEHRTGLPRGGGAVQTGAGGQMVADPFRLTAPGEPGA